jgi:hypothetical protein
MMKTIADSLDEAMGECETICTIPLTQHALESAAASTFGAGQRVLEAMARLELRADTDNFGSLVEAKWGYFDRVSATIRLRRQAVQEGHAQAIPLAMSLPLEWNNYLLVEGNRTSPLDLGELEIALY